MPGDGKTAEKSKTTSPTLEGTQMLYVKKTPEITEAMQFNGQNAAAIKQFLPNVVELENRQLKITTPQNVHIVAATQWICRSTPNGRVFLLDNFTFQATYNQLNIGTAAATSMENGPQPHKLTKRATKTPK